jgi:hypothetical protein
MGINIINKHATEQKGWGRGGDRVLKSTKMNTEKKETKDRKRKKRTNEEKEENIREEMEQKNMCRRRSESGKGGG